MTGTEETPCMSEIIADPASERVARGIPALADRVAARWQAENDAYRAELGLSVLRRDRRYVHGPKPSSVEHDMVRRVAMGREE